MEKDSLKNLVSNDANELELIKSGEEISEETLEEIKGGIDIGSSGGCCGIQLACNNKGKNVEKEQAPEAELSVM